MKWTIFILKRVTGLPKLPLSAPSPPPLPRESPRPRSQVLYPTRRDGLEMDYPDGLPTDYPVHESGTYGSLREVNALRPVGTNLKVRGHEQKLALTKYFLKSKREFPCVINSVFLTVKW